MDKKIKKMPERQCLGCNGHFPKNTLLRVVRAPDGQVSLDFTGKKSGRGAYICRDVKCLRRARKSLRIDRTLDCQVPGDVYDAMESELEAHGE